jgi:hypothetical protein
LTENDSTPGAGVTQSKKRGKKEKGWEKKNSEQGRVGRLEERTAVWKGDIFMGIDLGGRKNIFTGGWGF